MKTKVALIFCALLSVTACDFITGTSDRDGEAYLFLCEDITTSGDPAKNGCSPILRMQCSEAQNCTGEGGGMVCNSKDYFDECWVEKVGIGNRVYLEISADPNFETTLLAGKRSLKMEGAGEINFKFGGVMHQGASFFARVSINEASDWYYNGRNIVARTQRHIVTLPSDDNYEMTDNGYPEYRKMPVEVIPETVSCIDELVGGVSFCYWWEEQSCAVMNQSGTVVSFLVEANVKNNRTIIIDAKYLEPNESKIAPCGALQVGDQLVFSAWEGYVESAYDRITQKLPDTQKTATMTNDPIITINGTRTSEQVEHTLNKDSSQGVECTLLKEFLMNNGDMDREVLDTIDCQNFSLDNVNVRLYMLKESATAGLYERNYKLADFDMDANDPQKATPWHQETYSTEGLCGTFALDVRTEGWFGTPYGDDSKLRSVLPFTVDCGDWSITELSDTVYYEETAE